MKVKKEASNRSGVDRAWSTALRILSRRDYSVTELRERLLDKNYDSIEVEEVLKRCLDLNYLNDERFAANRATSLMKQGRAVGHRIIMDLRQRGIRDDLAEQALTVAREAVDEQALIAEILERRYPDFQYDSASAKEKRRVINFLQRRGFPMSTIMDQLTRKGS